MAQNPSATSVRRRYERQVSSALNLFEAVRRYCSNEAPHDAMHSNPLHPGQAKKVVALAFLQVVAGWEYFIEQVFVRYMAGAEFGGHPPLSPRIGVCNTIGTAYEILFGTPNKSPSGDYLTWTTHRTLERADLFFANGHPFRKPIIERQERLADAVKIRNRVAHDSDKSKNDFKKVALKHLGQKDQLPRRGYMVGDLLIEPAVRFFPAFVQEGSRLGDDTLSFFEAYLRMYMDMAMCIAPLPEDKCVER